MKKFEYRMERIMTMSEDVHKKLNELGAQGWELVAVANPSDFFFKREI